MNAEVDLNSRFSDSYFEQSYTQENSFNSNSCLPQFTDSFFNNTNDDSTNTIMDQTETEPDEDTEDSDPKHLDICKDYANGACPISREEESQFS